MGRSPERAAPARLVALAEGDPRRAGRLALGWLAAPGLDGARLFAAGWALLRWERLDAARDALAAAYAALPPTDLAGRLRCRGALLTARQLGGEGRRLQDQWEEHAGACEAAGAWGELARARCEQVAHLNLLGRPRAAWELAVAAHELVWAHGSPADRARHQHVAGVAANGCGELDRSLALLDGALAAFAQLGRPADLARVRFERSWLWQRREQYGPAEADLALALAAFRRFDLPLRVALCLRDLGLLARMRGDYGRAIARTVEARELFLALGRPDRAASCDFNLGGVAHMSGLHELAEAAYLRAEAAYTTLGDRAHALVAARNRAQLLCAQGRAGDALVTLEALAPAVAELGDALEDAELIAATAQALRLLGRPAAAAAALRHANERFLALGNRPAAGEALLDLAWLDLEGADSAAARAKLVQAQALIGPRPAHGWRVAYGLGRAALLDGDPGAALDHFARAIDTVAELRGTIVSEHASSGIYALARQLHLDALGLAADNGDPALVLALAEGQRSLTLARQMRAEAAAPPRELRARRIAARSVLRSTIEGSAGAPPLGAAIEQYLATLLQERHAAPVGAAPPQALDLDAVRARLSAAYGAGWTVLCPVFLEGELLSVILAPDTLALERQPFDQGLRELLERACRPTMRMVTYRDLAPAGAARAPWAPLAALGARLIPGLVRSRLAPGHRLLIVPAGPLHGLPWAALRVGDRWLCERAIVELLPGLGLAPSRPPAIGPAPALLVGCTTFGGRAAPLPATLATLELVAAVWRGPTERLAGAAATAEAIRALGQAGRLAQFGLIHLASHAQLGGADGLVAHIKLADDDLLLDELAQLGLRGAIVVLAACEGGAGAVLPGEEVLGLSRALLAAGARAVLASLWPIQDRGVLAILAPFYAALAAGADAAEALALAQRTMLAGADDGPELGGILRTPFVWGGYCLASGEAVTPVGPA